MPYSLYQSGFIVKKKKKKGFIVSGQNLDRSPSNIRYTSTTVEMQL